MIPDFLADSVIMNIPRDLGSRQQQLASIRAIQIVAFTDRPFHQQGAAAQIVCAAGNDTVGILLREICHSMMCDFAARDRSGTHFNSTNPTRLR